MLSADTHRVRLDILLILGLTGPAMSLGCNEDGSSRPSATSGQQADASSPFEPGEFELPLCEAPETIVRHQGGQRVSTGWVRCLDGRYLREHPVDCFDVVQPSSCRPGVEGGCQTNADCTEKPFGSCRLRSTAFPGLQPFPQPEPSLRCDCEYGCQRDADCGPGRICLCSSFGTMPGGHCVQSNCRAGAECDSGMCEHNRKEVGIGCNLWYSVVGCRSRYDTCVVDSDCASGSVGVNRSTCGPHHEERRWTCHPWAGSCGRPFFVGSQLRTAAARLGEQWGPRPAGVLKSRHLTAERRKLLAEHWTKMGLMEHASIGSFSRVVMQLLSMGAPSELLTLANQALADEIRHAKRCFELANTYLDHAIEPGPLPLDDCLEGQLTPLAIFFGCFEEACLGETQAYLEASEAARRCQDRATQSVLIDIARDERSHALFGWRMLRWVWGQLSATDRVQARIELGHRIMAFMIEIDQGPEPSPNGPSASLESHGLLCEVVERGVRVRALRDVVIPCTTEFLEGMPVQLEEVGLTTLSYTVDPRH